MKKVLAIVAIATVLTSCGSGQSLVNSCPAYAGVEEVKKEIN
jgi:hypothetical protein|tara:strand:+ start:552 stop:677 length:126 start_codon:yes stop_codon:yes gene_type:complete